jgi:hypothetical protein
MNRTVIDMPLTIAVIVSAMIPNPYTNLSFYIRGTFPGLVADTTISNAATASDRALCMPSPLVTM